ncbi:hypothetical protein D3C74_95110 [compost metagenome]
MISTVLELLNEIKKNGVEDILKYLNYNHNPTIGSMYEGLTKELLSKAIFDEFDLKVCSGKVTNSKGDLSKQIDCMLVIGEGRKLPFIEEYVYDFHQVVAVIEVKKNLYSSELNSAYQNLLSVIELTEIENDMKIDMLEMSYRNIYGQLLPEADKIKSLPFENQLLYNALMIECFLPLRIVFGYDSFASELSLRKAFLNYMIENKGQKSFGVVSLPSLIIAGNYSLVKTNGIPYSLPTNTKEWISYASYGGDPLSLLLELIWTRLYYIFEELDLGVFGYNDKIEALNPFLLAVGTTKGWEYTELKFTDFQRKIAEVWEPVEVTLTEYAIVHLLCKGREFRVDSKYLIDYCLEQGTTIENVIENLNRYRITCIENGLIELLTKECLCGIKQGKYYVGENVNGQMTRWLLQK